MLAVYDVEGRFALPWHRKPDQNKFGEGVRATSSEHGFQGASSHTFNSVNRHHCILLKRQATDRRCWGIDWLNRSDTAIL